MAAMSCSEGKWLSPGATDESYEIAADTTGASITAPTQWGALRALETFSQLVLAGGSGRYSLPAPPINVTDLPRFGYQHTQPSIATF